MTTQNPKPDMVFNAWDDGDCVTFHRSYRWTVKERADLNNSTQAYLGMRVPYRIRVYLKTKVAS